MSTRPLEKHIVSAFDDELKNLDKMIAEMGGLAELQLAEAIEALARRDTDLANHAIQSDRKLDALEAQMDETVVNLLALRQPMAADLRSAITALRTASLIERIGDYAKNIAKRSVVLSQSPPLGPTKTVKRMAALCQDMIAQVLDAYATRDAQKAEDVRHRDPEVDLLHTSLFREILTYMMEDPRTITSCTHLLFVAKNLERIGDHTTNIAENVYFLVNGERLEDEREKNDESSFAVVDLNLDI